MAKRAGSLPLSALNAAAGFHGAHKAAIKHAEGVTNWNARHKDFGPSYAGSNDKISRSTLGTAAHDDLTRFGQRYGE